MNKNIIATFAFVIVILLAVAVAIISYFLVDTQKQLTDAKQTINTVNITTPSNPPTTVSPYHNINPIKGLINSSTRNFKILCIGDSSMASSDSASDYPRDRCFPAFLADLFRVKSQCRFSENAFFGADSVNKKDVKLYNGLWNSEVFTDDKFGVGGYAMVTRNNSATLVYNIDSTDVNRVRIYVMANSSNFYMYPSLTAASGQLVNVSALPVAAGNIKVFTYTTSGFDRLQNIKLSATGATDANPVRIFGIVMDSSSYNNTIINASVSNNSTTTDRWIGTNGDTSLANSGLSAIAPNLVILSFGMGDATPNTANNVKSMATSIQSKGINVLVVIPGWTGNSTDSSVIADLKAKLDSASIPYYDLASDLVSYTNQQNLGISDPNATTSDHFTSLGHYRVAQGVFGCFT